MNDTSLCETNDEPQNYDNHKAIDPDTVAVTNKGHDQIHNDLNDHEDKPIEPNIENNANEPDGHNNTSTETTTKAIKKCQPFYFDCLNCTFAGLTIVEQKAASLSYHLIILLLILFGTSFASISCIIVSGILLSKYYHHKCPCCFKKVASYHKILSILNLQDKKRRIIFGSFLVIILCILLFIAFPAYQSHYGSIDRVKEKWEEFLDECGSIALKEQGSHRKAHCKEKYLHKTVVNWRGYIAEAKDYWDPKGPFQVDALVIYLRMMPSERAPFSDITLALDSETAERFYEVLLSLTKGTEISFDAKIILLEDKVRIFGVLDMKKEAGFMKISRFVDDDIQLDDLQLDGPFFGS